MVVLLLEFILDIRIIGWFRDEWQRWVHGVRPTDERHVVEALNDGAFKLDHHLDIRTVLDIIAIQASDVPVHDQILCMECPKRRAVVVHDLHRDVLELLLRGQPDLGRLPPLGGGRRRGS